MKNIEKIAIGTAILLSLVGLGLQLVPDKPQQPPQVTVQLPANLGNIFTNADAYSGIPTYSSTTFANNLATLIIPRATSSRAYAQICLLEASTSTVWLYKATSTGAVPGVGDPIFSSSTQADKHCKRYDASDPFTGAVYAISRVTSTLIYEFVQD